MQQTSLIKDVEVKKRDRSVTTTGDAGRVAAVSGGDGEVELDARQAGHRWR